eukprot:357522-Chlamydomonas_euryale.AAC.3
MCCHSAHCPSARQHPPVAHALAFALTRCCASALIRCCASALIRCCASALTRCCASALTRCCASALIRCCASALIRCCASALIRCCASALIRCCARPICWLRHVPHKQPFPPLAPPPHGRHHPPLSTTTLHPSPHHHPPTSTRPHPPPFTATTFTATTIHRHHPQAVFSGPASSASAHFAALGHAPPSASVAIADHMLDVVIRCTKEEVLRLVDAYMASECVGVDGCVGYLVG